ncbi:MAG: LysR family transcriptional regulator [Sulfitobacter sp.]
MPPLTALRAFCAFAQSGSVVAAGAALGVSHAAISQQLRQLEAHLDVSLVDRTGRALRLTPAGRALAAGAEAGFGEIAQTIRDITGAGADRALHITTTPTFASAWLMPRLPAFRAQAGDIDLTIDPTPKVIALTPDGAEVAIRYGDGHWPGLEASILIRSPMVVVAAPSLIGDCSPQDAGLLARLTWLEEFGTTESSRWLAQQGIVHRTGARMNVPGNLLLDGARDGQGAAVTVRAFVERDIAAGRLTVVWEEMKQDAGYYVVTRAGVHRPALKAFVAWIKRESRAER